MPKVALKICNITFVILIIAFLYPMTFASRLSTSAVSLSDLENQINSIQKQISADNAQSQALSGQIGNLSQKVQIDGDIITQKEALISSYNQQIADLTASITSLQSEIAQLSALKDQLNIEMNQRAKTSYENTFVDPIQLLFGNSNINDTVTSLVYFDSAREEDMTIMNNYVTTLNEYNLDQTNLVNQQNTLQLSENAVQAEELQLQSDKSNLLAEQNQLSQQKESVDSNTSQLQQQEQTLVEQMNALSIKSFSGSGCRTGNSWYYCQQWYGTLPGERGTSIDMTYGCLITSIAMVATYEVSAYYTPPVIASMTWFSDNNMEAWPNIPGVTPVYIGSSTSAINSQIAAGHPVIAYMNAPYGEHWIVLYARSGNDDYMINDPWYGSELTFNGTGGGTHEYYSLGELGYAYVLE